MAQKHHYIPAFYLKQWTGLDGRLCEFSKPHNTVKPRMTHPDGTGYVRGLYSFGDLPAVISNYLERVFFNRADDRACATLRMLLAGHLPEHDADAKSAWSRFLMTLIFRNPEAVERAKQQIETGFPAEIARLRTERSRMNEGGLAETLEEIKAGISTETLQRTTLLHLNQIMDSQNVGNALNRMAWAVVTLYHTSLTLLTSDRPIIMTNGIGHDDSHIVLPISPIHVFVAARTNTTMRDLIALTKRTDFIEISNDFMARQARRFVYGVDDSQLRFIANRFGERRRSTPLE